MAAPSSRPPPRPVERDPVVPSIRRVSDSLDGWVGPLGETAGTPSKTGIETRRALSTLVRNLPGLVYRCLHDAQWTTEFVGGACRELTGYDADDFLAQRITFEALVHPEDREGVRRKIDAALKARRPYRLDYRLLHADGSVRWAWEQGCGVFDEKGELEALEGIILDVTERRWLEEQLAHAQKMDAMGRLAGAIAHDFNNLITIIASYASFAERSVVNDEPMREDLREIGRAAKRGADLVRQLLDLGRKQSSPPRVVEVNETLSSLRLMLERLLGDSIQLELCLTSRSTRILADPVQLDQLVINLATNAKDAMPTGGRLSIRTSVIDVMDSPAHPARMLRTGGYVQIVVEDTGTGMDADVKEHIFEPFYTTKEPGRGTGLGLATVYGIVQRNDGSIRVESTKGEGTTFVIHWPLVNAPLTLVSSKVELTDLPIAEGRILLYEPDAALRTISRRALEEHGYAVVEATSPAGVHREIAAHDRPFDAVVCDLDGHGQLGHRFAERIASDHPSMRMLLLVSGNRSFSPESPLAESHVALLFKPFTPDRLLLSLRALLQGGENAPAKPPR